MKRFFCVALLASGCATTVKVGHDDNTDRIDVEMRREVYSDATPGAGGIVLGPDAPPLAVISYSDTNYSYGRHGYGYGSGYGGYGNGGFLGGARHGPISYPNLPGNNGQTFGGGTAGGGPHPASGGNFSGGDAGGSPHAGFHGGGGFRGGRGGGGHR